MIHFDVVGMHCEHCVRAVTQAIKARDESATIRVDLAKGTVDVAGTVPAPRIAEAIEEAGYQVKRR